MTCIMGKSGIGKSTLLSILMGLEKADEGTVSGMEHQKISAIFQENRLFENLDAVTNIHITTGKTKEEITGFLKKMELDDIAGKPVSEYSGGMKRRVAIARALLAEYDILIMDEPLQGLDAETKEKVATVIKTQTAGKTVLFVTHDEKFSRQSAWNLSEFTQKRGRPHIYCADLPLLFNGSFQTDSLKYSYAA